MNQWHQSLEQYSVEEHGGDMSFLREENGSAKPAHFTILGGKSPEDSTDVTGVLVGRREIDGNNWLVFLIARVKQREVDDIRVAMLGDRMGKRQWLVSRADEPALRSYCSKLAAARGPSAENEEIMLLPTGFPSERDVYLLEVSGNTVSVREQTSGARWTLVMPQSKALTKAN